MKKAIFTISRKKAGWIREACSLHQRNVSLMREKTLFTPVCYNSHVPNRAVAEDQHHAMTLSAKEHTMLGVLMSIIARRVMREQKILRRIGPSEGQLVLENPWRATRIATKDNFIKFSSTWRAKRMASKKQEAWLADCNAIWGLSFVQQNAARGLLQKCWLWLL